MAYNEPVDIQKKPWLWLYTLPICEVLLFKYHLSFGQGLMSNPSNFNLNALNNDFVVILHKFFKFQSNLLN